MDLRSTRRDITDATPPDQIMHKSDDETIHDDKTSSGGRDTIVPEVLESENDEMIFKNENPRGGKNNVRPNPTSNYTAKYRY